MNLRLWIGVFVLVGMVLFLVARSGRRSTISYLGLQPRATVAERLEQYGPAARKRLFGSFRTARIKYPPKRLIWVAFKEENILQILASDGGPYRFIRSYPILKSSGRMGPKLREGDFQVPEGFYRVESLNPNSLFHLSVKLNYPNAFDREQAARENRTDLGGDIMIHGNQVSIGCLAMGDEVAEDLFVLAADTGQANIEVIISPIDLRHRTPTSIDPMPDWVQSMYRSIEDRLRRLPLETTS